MIINGVLQDIEVSVNAREVAISEIELAKEQLSATDYQAIKHSEGEMSEEEYAPIREVRRQLRRRINELEEQL